MLGPTFTRKTPKIALLGYYLSMCFCGKSVKIANHIFAPGELTIPHCFVIPTVKSG